MSHAGSSLNHPQFNNMVIYHIVNHKSWVLSSYHAKMIEVVTFPQDSSTTSGVQATSKNVKAKDS